MREIFQGVSRAKRDFGVRLRFTTELDSEALQALARVHGDLDDD